VFKKKIRCEVVDWSYLAGRGTVAGANEHDNEGAITDRIYF
jgi:hypothetical protein